MNKISVGKFATGQVDQKSIVQRFCQKWKYLNQQTVTFKQEGHIFQKSCLL